MIYRNIYTNIPIYSYRRIFELLLPVSSADGLFIG